MSHLVENDNESRLTENAVAVLAVAAGAVVLAGCGSGGGGGGALPPGIPTSTPIVPIAPVDPATQPALTVTGISVSATTSAAATVSVAGVEAPVAGSVRFALDNAAASTSRAADPGLKQAERAYLFTISATGTSGSASGTCTVTLNPAVERVLPATDARVAQIRHLFGRIAFSANEDDLGRWLNVPYATMVNALVDGANPLIDSQAAPAAATFVPLTWYEFNALSLAEQEVINDRRGVMINELYTWWFREIVISRQSLVEKMALFWHNLLVVSAGDVFEARPLWDYLTLLRRNSLGSFRDLLHAISRDPAMVKFLDSNSNVKGRPNENFARELLELFTLGEGQVYTEQDVVEVAKCFTGWGVDDRGFFRRQQNRHELGPKNVLGASISFPDSDPEQVRKDGEAVIERILAQPRVAVFIAEKMWDEFIGGTRDAAAITAWANAFRGSGDYDIRRLLKAVLTHNAFTQVGARGTMIRSPVELHAMLFRSIGIEPANYGTRHWMAGGEDQTLLSPPNVRGWVGGNAWISAKSLVERRTHMQWTGWELYNDGNQKVPARLRGALTTLWFNVPPVQQAYIDGATAITWDVAGERIRRLLVDPAINLK